MTNLEYTEYLRSRGFLSDRYYYQLNGKDAETNYIEILRNRSKQLWDLYYNDDTVDEIVISSEVKD